MEVPHETFLKEWERDLSRSDLIKQRGTIKCSYKPYIWTLGWKFSDIIKKVADNNDLQVEITEQTWYWVIAKRTNWWYTDVFCSPVRPTKSRKLELFFSESIALSNIYGYVQSNSPFATMSFQQLQQEKNVRIAVKKNDIHHDIVDEFFPHARIIRIPQLSPVWEEINYVLDKGADIAFWEYTLVDELLKKQSRERQILTQISKDWEPVKVYENCIALPWWEFELKEMIDEVIREP